jgi:hypothetical protein
MGEKLAQANEVYTNGITKLAKKAKKMDKKAA